MNKTVFILSIVAVATIAGFVKVSSAQTMQPQTAQVTAPAPAAPAPAAPAPEIKRGKKDRSGVFSRIYLADIVATLVYSLMGLVIALFGYKVYDWITPFDLRKELEIDQNTALGIVCGAIIIGLCIIVAAAIMSP